MATQLTIVNKVLEELREDQVTTVAANAYTKLIARFVNKSKEDMEDINHKWSVYITEVSDTWPADGSTVAIDVTETNDRSVLLRDEDRDWVPQAYDVTTNEVGQLFDCSYKALLKERAIGTNDTSKTNDTPRAFAIRNDADGRGWTIEIPDPVSGTGTARSWLTYWYIPQAAFATDGTDDSTEVKLPERPILARAIYYAQNERGEEMGQPNGILWQESLLAIGSAAERDLQVNKNTYAGVASHFNNEECL